MEYVIQSELYGIIHENEYIRCEDGTITVLTHEMMENIKIEPPNINVLLGYESGLGENETRVIDHASTIKEILEVGDIIEYSFKCGLETGGEAHGVISIDDIHQLADIKKNDGYKVLAVITKEKYESIKFKVGDEK